MKEHGMMFHKYMKDNNQNDRDLAVVVHERQESVYLHQLDLVQLSG